MQQPFTSLNPNPNFTKIINKKKLNKEFTCYNKKSKPIFHKNQNWKLNNLNVKYPNPNPNFTIIKTKNQINNLPSKIGMGNQASLTSAKESWMLSAPHWRFTPSYKKQITCNIKLLQKESKSGEREHSIQYHIQLQDRLHNLHYKHTTTFKLQFKQEKMVLKSNSSAIFEKIA